MNASVAEFRHVDKSPNRPHTGFMETLLKFTHELVMFFAVAVSLGGSTMVFRLARTDNLPGIQAVFRYFAPTAKMIAPLYGAGTLLGLATVWVMGIPWLKNWLVISYALTIFAAILGRVTEGWAQKVAQLAAAETGSAPSAALKAVLTAKAPRVIRMIDMLLILIFVALMVFRPSLWPTS